MPRCPKCQEPVEQTIEFCPVCSAEIIDQFPRMVKGAAIICAGGFFLVMIVIWVLSNAH